VLRFTGENVEVPFLKDHEIKKSAHKGGLGDSSLSQSGVENTAEPDEAKKQEMIKKLEEMGATKEQATALLKKTWWNVEVAASAFFEMQQQGK